jgi:hypothetical protein
MPMAQPSRMIWDGNRLLLLDRGYYQEITTDQNSEWRADPHRFGVIVFLSAERPTSREERQQVFLTLSRVLNRERPAHVIWNFQFASDPGAGGGPLNPGPPGPFRAEPLQTLHSTGDSSNGSENV